jgi:hypothetical protein
MCRGQKERLALKLSLFLQNLSHFKIYIYHAPPPPPPKPPPENPPPLKEEPLK